MSRLLLFAIIIPVLGSLLFKYQESDLTLLVYKTLGQSPSALRGKVVWITGASSGIGEYLAYELVQHGCKLVLSARRKDELERVKKKCAEKAEQLMPSFKEDYILILSLDLSKFSTHKELAEKVLKHFGKIDILVNNGGQSQRAWFVRTPLKVDQALIDTNVIGTVSLTKAVLPNMMQRREGQIVTVSSILGKAGFPVEATYCATKHALHGYFDSLRIELFDLNIHVQVVCPGPVISEVAQNAATEDIGVNYKNSGYYSEMVYKGMATQRCAELMAVAMVNRLDEVWISEYPALVTPYMGQYMPDLYRWISKRFLPDMIQKKYKMPSRFETKD